MKIIGIGNAIVDVICRIDEDFLIKNKLTKSTMKLVDENEFKQLLSNLNVEKTIAGGSVANSIVGLAQLKNLVSFIGKVNEDKLGNEYEKSLTDEKVKYCYNKKIEKIPTGTCLILVTPDSERTMCTFLGIAGKITPEDIDENFIKQSELVFLEGYLWDEGEPKAAFDKALTLARKSAMSLSDKFCVDRHKKSFYNLVKNKLDNNFLNSSSSTSFIVLLVNPLLDKKLSSILQITSTIAFPIPIIFIIFLSFLYYNWLFPTGITRFTNFAI